MLDRQVADLSGPHGDRADPHVPAAGRPDDELVRAGHQAHLVGQRRWPASVSATGTARAW